MKLRTPPKLYIKLQFMLA